MTSPMHSDTEKLQCRNKPKPRLLAPKHGTAFHQIGTWNLIPAFTFGSAQNRQFWSKKYCLVQPALRLKPIYSSIAEGEHEGFLKVQTVKIKPSSHYKILYRCVKGHESLKLVSSVGKGYGCWACASEERSQSKRSSPSAIKKICTRYKLKEIRNFRNFNTPCTLVKSCDCHFTFLLANLKDGIPRCKHDATTYHRVIQMEISDALGGCEKTIPKVGRPDCVIPEKKELYEIKGSLSALVKGSWGDGKQNLEQVKRYQKYAVENDFNFHIIVNDSQEDIDLAIRHSIVSRFHKIILGWERWHEVGLTEKVVRKAKALRKKPGAHRVWRKTKSEKKEISKYVRACKQAGTVLGHHRAAQKGFVYGKICRLMSGKLYLTSPEMAKQLRKLGCKVQYWRSAVSGKHNEAK